MEYSIVKCGDRREHDANQRTGNEPQYNWDKTLKIDINIGAANTYVLKPSFSGTTQVV